MQVQTIVEFTDSEIRQLIKDKADAAMKDKGLGSSTITVKADACEKQGVSLSASVVFRKPGA